MSFPKRLPREFKQHRWVNVARSAHSNNLAVSLDLDDFASAGLNKPVGKLTVREDGLVIHKSFRNLVEFAVRLVLDAVSVNNWTNQC